MKKSILKSSIALAVAGVFGATVAVTAAEQATPVPVAQEVAVTAAPVAQPVADQAVPTIERGSSGYSQHNLLKTLLRFQLLLKILKLQ